MHPPRPRFVTAQINATWFFPWMLFLPQAVLLAIRDIRGRAPDRDLAILALAWAGHGARTPGALFLAFLVFTYGRQALRMGALALAAGTLLVAFYLVSAAMLIYLPLGKIRHCLYFFFSRTFFGKFFGRRGVLPHPEPAK